MAEFPCLRIKISDRKGYTLKEARLEYDSYDDKYWIIIPAEIYDRAMAYQLYLREKRNQPLQVSAEYRSTPKYVDFVKYQTNIRPHLITIADKGHIEGNKIRIIDE